MVKIHHQKVAETASNNLKSNVKQLPPTQPLPTDQSNQWLAGWVHYFPIISPINFEAHVNHVYDYAPALRH